MGNNRKPAKKQAKAGGYHRPRRNFYEPEVQMNVRCSKDFKHDVQLAAVAYAARQGYRSSSMTAFILDMIRRGIESEKRRDPSLDFRTVKTPERKKV